MEINEVDTKNEQVGKDLIAYLTPHETQALFLLGNIQSHLQPSFLYIAEQQGRMVGVCGYYPTFRSCSFFKVSYDRMLVLEKDAEMTLQSVGAKWEMFRSYEERQTKLHEFREEIKAFSLFLKREFFKNA